MNVSNYQENNKSVFPIPNKDLDQQQHLPGQRLPKESLSPAVLADTAVDIKSIPTAYILDNIQAILASLVPLPHHLVGRSLCILKVTIIYQLLPLLLSCCSNK